MLSAVHVTGLRVNDVVWFKKKSICIYQYFKKALYNVTTHTNLIYLIA